MKSIIEKLASKELSFGTELIEKYSNLKYKVGHLYPNKGALLILQKTGGHLNPHFAEPIKELIIRISRIELEEDFNVLGHPVYKHHVEKYLRENGILYQNLEKLTLLWEHFNFEKSLQQIEEESWYETGYLHDGEFIPSECTVEVTRLKDPKARELEQFISNLIFTT